VVARDREGRLIGFENRCSHRGALICLEPQGRGFQAVPDIAGVSIFRSYSVLNPQQVIRPRGDRTFRLERPSTVEVIVNGQQVRRLQLAPGNYNLPDFPFAQGGNHLRLNGLDLIVRPALTKARDPVPNARQKTFFTDR